MLLKVSCLRLRPRTFELALLPMCRPCTQHSCRNTQLIGELYTTIAVQHMTTYWAILEKTRGSKLRLTKIDDEIYDHFKKDFPEFDTKATIDEDTMKSKDGKERWRKFIMEYEKRIDDYNFGTMLRANPNFEYGEKETIFGAPLFPTEGTDMTLIPPLALQL